MDDTCTFWGVAGCHAPNLKKIALALAPLPCSSGEAERSWHELKLNKTKTRNRLSTERIQKMMFVRRFLHLKRKLVRDIDSGLAEWIKKLLRNAARDLASIDNVVPEGGNDDDDLETLRIFNDKIEPGEQGAINGKEPGIGSITLTELRKDNSAKSRLFEKYYNMCFLDKNPEDDPTVDLDDESNWEHRMIQNVVWARRKGYVVETVIIPTGDDEDPDQGTVETYEINTGLLDMIRASPNNTRQMQSLMNVNEPDTSNNIDSDSDSDSGSIHESGSVATV